MSDVARWVDRREPSAPRSLTEQLRELLRSDPAAARARRPGDGEAETREVLDVVRSVGRERLAAAIDRPGRVRATAFDLLATDALITYACEAALEVDDVDGALARIAAVSDVR